MGGYGKVRGGMGAYGRVGDCMERYGKVSGRRDITSSYWPSKLWNHELAITIARASYDGTAPIQIIFD